MNFYRLVLEYKNASGKWTELEHKDYNSLDSRHLAQRIGEYKNIIRNSAERKSDSRRFKLYECLMREINP